MDLLVSIWKLYHFLVPSCKKNLALLKYLLAQMCPAYQTIFKDEDVSLLKSFLLKGRKLLLWFIRRGVP